MKTILFLLLTLPLMAVPTVHIDAPTVVTAGETHEIMLTYSDVPEGGRVTFVFASDDGRDIINFDIDPVEFPGQACPEITVPDVVQFYRDQGYPPHALELIRQDAANLQYYWGLTIRDETNLVVAADSVIVTVLFEEAPPLESLVSDAVRFYGAGSVIEAVLDEKMREEQNA